jgi:hypothetical protein
MLLFPEVKQKSETKCIFVSQGQHYTETWQIMQMDMLMRDRVAGVMLRL